jgi:hypothetical protein
MPDVPNNQKVLRLEPDAATEKFGTNVSGNGHIESDNIIFVSSVSDLEYVRRLNDELVGYVIIANLPLSEISKNLSFADYSNAAAIVCVHNAFNSVASHFNGATREANILLLAGNIDRRFLSGLRPGQNNVRVAIYANDAKQVAFMATL